jgi:hypothetical protein
MKEPAGNGRFFVTAKTSSGGRVYKITLCVYSRSTGFQRKVPGNGQRMTEAEDRERESRLNEENKFVEQTEEVAEEQREKAARLANDPVVNESGDEE